ncbi:DUF4167 domain-containing protein [Sphingomonas sp. 37zxx]|uniref:DUF4167 domain-containing protein n=1 Tax=Sphingomonas sp. 37zxx TaxID=1550073 RepID=UPI000ABF9B41|nr:DUF4167 domain-containing protein [Sphingomonas sp. 37zxx]
MNNRQAGRRRGRGGQRPQSGGSPNRQDNGNRIDSRARGNAAQLLEKYKNLARDSQMQGDRVNTEYYLQFADHYFRVLSETRSRFEENNGQRRQRDDIDDDDDDFDGENEGGTADYRDDRGQREGSQRENGQRENGQRENGQREGGQRERGGRDQGNRDQGNRDQGNRDEGNRDSGNREARDYGRDRPQPRADRDQPRADGNRSEGNRSDGNRAEGNRAEGNRERPRREPRAEPVRAPEPAAEPIAAQADLPVEEAPRRRGRPRRQVEAVVTEESSAPESAGIEADRLPPSFGFANDDNVEDVPAEKPRRRRRVRGEEDAVPSAE